MRTFIILSLFIFSTISFAEINFFDSKIDFWKDKKVESKQEHIKDSKAKFDWKTYKDPENDEFFREGNYLPPKPFLEVARRPTDKNIKNWMDYINQKNQIQKRFLAALREYQKKNNLGAKANEVLETKISKVNFIPSENSKISISTYFLTTCPACKKMFNTLEILQNKGVYVEAIQIDTDKYLKKAILVPMRMAEEKEIKGMKESGLGVPYSIIRINGKAQTLSGYQTPESIMLAIQNIANKGGVQ